MALRVRFAACVMGVCLAVAAVPAFAQNVQTGGQESLTIKGFISATFFAQDQNFGFGNGQNAQWPAPPEFTKDKWFLDGDVRNTRITMVFNGPELDNNLKLGGVIEVDFFGGFNGTGFASDEQPNPRLRLGYVDIHKGRTTYRIGQAWSPLFGNVPKSLSHIAFPLGYGAAGFPGWRFPGLYIYQPLSAEGAATQTKLSLGFFRGSWNGPGNNVNSGSAGNAAWGPQVEARLDWSGKTSAGSKWGFYVVGHYDQKDLSGADAEAPNDSLDGYAGELGASFKTGPFLIHGNAYFGKAIGQQFGQITQFGDIQSWGAWMQLGYDFADHWTGYLFYGVDKPDEQDVLAAVGASGRMQNQMADASLMYTTGPYGFSVEWLHSELETGPDKIKTKGNQISTSVIYHF